MSKKYSNKNVISMVEFDSGMGGGFKKCYENHKPLPLKDGLVVHGGSCAHPTVTDADIYVGLDYSIAKVDKAYPWVDGESFLFHIPDMGVPANPEQFKQLIIWLAAMITEGKKVHIGCIGGHGRTGMVLSALVKTMLEKEDAITYVRENYCTKAVESVAQVKFLHTHFGIKEVASTKTGLYGGVHSSAKPTGNAALSFGGSYPPKSANNAQHNQTSMFEQDEVDELDISVDPLLGSAVSVWGKLPK
jgi:protein-tyrosine phosphatase